MHVFYNLPTNNLKCESLQKWRKWYNNGQIMEIKHWLSKLLEGKLIPNHHRKLTCWYTSWAQGWMYKLDFVEWRIYFSTSTVSTYQTILKFDDAHKWENACFFFLGLFGPVIYLGQPEKYTLTYKKDFSWKKAQVCHISREKNSISSDVYNGF
jgi:hypothetical protein